MGSTTHLDGETLRELFTGGLSNLKLHSKEVDELNVFPVPDGDTGTNMFMTLRGGVNALQKDSFLNVPGFAGQFSRGALLGARGNSGVILSQFIRGLTNEFKQCTTVTVSCFLKAFRQGVENAYDAVLNPTEGTMLTVMREGCECLECFREANQESCFETLFEQLNRSMKASLDRTPELLPVLKEAGVVDSGGAGFYYIFQGMEKVLKGEVIASDASADSAVFAVSGADESVFHAGSRLEFGYCTEFLLQLQKSKVDISSFDKKIIVDFLEQAGDSIVAVQDRDIIKIHVHTFKPGDILNFCQQFGEFITLKIENMSVQHNEILLGEKRRTKKMIKKPLAIVAAVSGRGLRNYFLEIGADVIVDGGQTDNPSTEDFLEAFAQIEAETILVLPCNSNIMMAAEQAANLYKKAAVRVIPAKTVAEGYSALSMMNLSFPAEEVVRDMEDAISGTTTALVTTATRDVEYEHLRVEKGHFIGLSGDRVLSDSPDRLEAVRLLLSNIGNIREKAVIAVFYGASVSKTELSGLGELIQNDFPWLEYGFIEGGQEIYDYIMAVE